MIRGYLDSVKHGFKRINITHQKQLIELENSDRDNKDKHQQFLRELGQLLFSEPPYVFNAGEFLFRDQECVLADLVIQPAKPNLKHLLCKGQPLDIGPYIVITTKIRYLPKTSLDVLISGFWQLLRSLSTKHKIVILGERTVEPRGEYVDIGPNQVYTIYNDIVNNIPADRIIDLTIPSAGVTSPVLSKIQQDCLIMRDAQFVITLGIGGNLCMAIATANTIGYRTDQIKIADILYNKPYPDMFITKDWPQFIQKLQSYE